MRSTQLLPAFEVHRKLPVNYSTMYAGKETFIHSHEKFPAVGLYAAGNAYVSPYGVVFQNGRVCRDSVYGMFSPAKQWPSFIKKIVLGKTRRLEEPHIVAHHAYYENYYHWLCEILPRLYVTLKAFPGKKPALLMHSKQPRFVREYLGLFEGLRVTGLEDDELARAPEVHFTSPVARPLAYHEALMRELSAWLCERLEDPAQTLAPEKIFITRKNARYRITHNEAQIQAWLEGKGFTALAPENYSVREQMNLFKNARIIIGSHGAGFSNLIFARSCELIVDIIHREHPQDCFYNLAAALGSGTYFFQCPGAGKLHFKNNDDVIADPDAFIREVGPYISS